MFKCIHYKDTSSSEVKNQRAIVKRTSQIMKFGQDVIIKNGQMYNIQNRKGHYGAPDRVNILYSHRHIHTHINHTYICTYTRMHNIIQLYNNIQYIHNIILSYTIKSGGPQCWEENCPRGYSSGPSFSKHL